MNDTQGTFAALVGLVGSTLSALADDLSSPQRACALLADVGIVLDAPPASVTSLAARANRVRDDCTALQRANEDESLAAALALSTSVAALVQALLALDDDPALAIADFDNSAPVAVGSALLDRLLVDALESGAPSFHAALSLGGIVESRDAPTSEPAVPAGLPNIALRWGPSGGKNVAGVTRPADVANYARPTMDWSEPGADVPVRRKRTIRIDRLRTLLSNPIDVLEDVFAWGSSGFDGDALLLRLERLLRSLGVTASSGVVSRSSTTYEREVHAPVFSGIATYGIVAAGLRLHPVAAKALGGNDGGFAITPYSEGAAQLSFAISDDTSLVLSGDMDLSGNVRVVLRPPLAAALEVDALGSGAGDTGGSLSATLRIAPPQGFAILKQPGLVELGADAIEIAFEADHVDGVLAPGFCASVSGGTLTLGAAEADSFLRAVVPSVSAAFDCGIRWSERGGFALSGGAGLAATIPLDVQLGPVFVDSLDIEIDATERDALATRLRLTAAIEIGPIAGIVEGIGVELPVRLAERGGNLGKLEVEALRFVPPTGLGLAVDAQGVVTGGGFISLDHEAGRYAGVVSLQMLSVGLTAVGIVETKLRDDPDGWSLFLSVVADFTPVPLGFGFMLNGVGGFMGLHRTFDQDALAEGAREGRLDSLLFPEDPLADAARIIADVNTYFPTRTGTHAFGAMARIVWGVPTIVSAELGIILTVPDFEIALVGEIEALLPDEAAPLLELHMSVVGYADVAGGTFWIAASIYDSKLVGQHLSGDMAMYLTLGAEPYFVLSVGGFHPEWDVPAMMPSSLRSLRRMSASVDLGSSFQAGLDSYFAITSNTLQFGAEVWGVARTRVVGIDFTAEGWFGFDVLIVFTPFSIVAGMHAGVVIKAERETLLGVQLSLHLEGPKPWYATGRAEFRFLGFDIAFRVEVGDRVRGESQDTIDLWTALEPALREPETWLAPDLAAAVPEIALRALDVSIESGVWLAPDGVIEVRQHLVPLDRQIEVYGELVPSGTTRFDIEAAGLRAGVEGEWSVVEDLFAPAQYMELKPAERLGAPSFERMHAGATIGSGGWTAPNAKGDLASTDLEYEELVLESDETIDLGVRAAAALPRAGVAQRARGLLAPGARRAVAGVSPLRVAPSRYTLVKPATAARTQTDSVLYADAVATRRSLGAGSRIVPTHAVLT